MSLRFIDDKIMTSNPFIDLILYNLKVLGFNCVIKDQKKADNAVYKRPNEIEPALHLTAKLRFPLDYRQSGR